MANSLVAKWKVRLTTGVPPLEPPSDGAEQNNDEEKNNPEKNEGGKDRTEKAEKNQGEKEESEKGMCSIFLSLFGNILNILGDNWT